jgi:hypothetical protein
VESASFSRTACATSRPRSWWHQTTGTGSDRTPTVRTWDNSIGAVNQVQQREAMVVALRRVEIVMRSLSNTGAKRAGELHYRP